MNIKVLTVILTCFCVIWAAMHLPLSHRHLTEKQVEALIPLGIDETEVFKKLGRPTFEVPDTHGTKCLEYFNGRPQTKDLNYIGFVVFVKDGKVTSVGPIRGKTNRLSN